MNRKRLQLYLLLIITFVVVVIIQYLDTRVKTGSKIWKLTSGQLIENKWPPRKVPIVSVPSKHSMIKLDWTSVYNHKGSHVFTLVSAYYDNRREVPDRPAVVIIGYVPICGPKIDLTCIFKYSNGMKVCLNSSTAKQELINCKKEDTRVKAHSVHIICPLLGGNELPLAVQLSYSKSCNPKITSGEISVGNRHVSNTPPAKKIGVCIQGAVRQSGDKNFLKKLINFVRTCQFLGADFITMYASPDQLDRDIIDYFLTNYSQFVNMIEWKTLEAFNPTHYFGQFELMHDCMFRHMHEVEYIALFDVDEMIIPFKHTSWPEMLKTLEHMGGKDHIGYMFLSRYYVPSKQSYKQLDQCTESEKNSLFFTRTNEVQCHFPYKDHTKMILAPKTIVHSKVHEVCQYLDRSYAQVYYVPLHMAVSAHYRKKLSLWCVFHTRKEKFDHFKPLVDKYARSFCSVTNNMPVDL